MDDHQERLKKNNKKTSPFVFFLIKCVKSIWWRPEKAFNFLSRRRKKKHNRGRKKNQTT